MTELLTPRLHCSQLKQEDWSFSRSAERSAGDALYSRFTSAVKYARPSIRVFHRGRRGKTVAVPVVRDRETRIPAGSDRLPVP